MQRREIGHAMIWFLWILVGYYVLNVLILVNQAGKIVRYTNGLVTIQIIIWFAIITGLLVILL